MFKLPIGVFVYLIYGGIAFIMITMCAFFAIMVVPLVALMYILYWVFKTLEKNGKIKF